MRRIVTTMTAVALAVALLAAPGVRADEGRESPQQSSANGKTLGEWMQLYWTWAYTGVPASGQVGQVKLLALPSGEWTGGSGTYDDPAVFVGHLDLTLKPGTPFVLPVFAWLGETYSGPGGAGYPDDPVVPARFFTDRDPNKAIMKVYIDGKRVMDSTKASVKPFSYGPVPMDVTYPAPSSYGSTGIVFAEGIGFVHEPLSVGTHTIQLESMSRIPPDARYLNLDLYPEGTGFHYINSWTITVSPVLPQPGVFPPQSHPYGRSYGEWGAAWQQWCFTTTTANCPVTDNTGERALVNQWWSPVYFLAGTFGALPDTPWASPDPVTRNVTIPAGTALCMPIYNWGLAYPEDLPGVPPEDAVATMYEMLNAFFDPMTEADLPICEIDGVAVKNILIYRAQSEPFWIYVPAHNVQNDLMDYFTTGQTTPPFPPYYAKGWHLSTSDGFYVILKPLSAGKHTIHLGAPAGTSWPHVYYNLTVKGGH
jgi:hypothetical protein